MAQLKTGTALSALIWLGISLYGAYFIKQVVHPPRDEKGIINFGIDLVGGTYLTLDVKVEETIKNDLMEVMVGLADRVKKEGKLSAGVPSVDQEKLQGILPFSSASDASTALSWYTPDAGLPKVTQDGKELRFEYSEGQQAQIQEEAVRGNIATLRSRLDYFGAGEVHLVPQGTRRIGIELPDVRDPEKVKQSIGKAAVLELKPVYDYARNEDELLDRSGGSLPDGTMMVTSAPQEGGGVYLVPSFAKITGKQLRNSEYAFQQGGMVQKSPHTVKITFKGDGVRRFAEMTANHRGKQIAIILDNQVISAPVVNEAIESGEAYISGNFQKEQAQQLVAFLKSGAFSAPVEFIEERHIGPSLGEESVRRGLISCGIALVLLFLFSILVYKLAGLFAFVVLLYNLLFILFGLAMVPDATLTLPGIAGMVLTIGMAIDSSILIYERIREELLGGASLKNAVDAGFGGALSVILDANATTFIVGAVLYYLGSPAIQGFALTMMIGIIATLITGLILLRSFFNWYMATGAQSISI